MYKQTLYKYVVERNPIAQIIINTEGQVVYWNNSAYELYKYTEEEVQGKKIEGLILFDENEIQNQIDFLTSKSYKSEFKVILDLLTRDKYQIEIPVKIDFTLISIEEGWIMLTITDRTQESKKEEQLIRKQKQLEKYIESNLQLENFTFIASHNLKLPIQNIINFSSYLSAALSERLSQKEKQYLTIIEENSSRIKEIIQLLADYSSISNIPLNQTINSTEQILTKAIKDLEPRIIKTGASIQLGEFPETIYVDKYLIQQLFIYLIHNSLLYVHEKVKPEIHISAIQEGNCHVFCVEDNGIGISNTALVGIFGMFKRLHNDKVYKGYGVGLAFCKKIIERHNGDIWVESIEERGSRFFIKIPF